MPYTKEHRQRSRERILESASRLFPHRGYEAVSIDDLMREAGLTRGAFYNHFSDKAEVYAEAIVYAAMKSPLAAGSNAKGAATEASHRLLEAYLSRQHIDNSEWPCPLAFLVTDVGTRESKVRAAYTRVFRGLVRLLGRDRPRRETQKGEEAMLAVTVLMIGGVAIGRALDSRALSDRLLASCRAHARHILEQA